MINALFSRNKSKQDSLKMKFDKQDKIWVVLKGQSIMFMGQQEQCKTYINQFG